MDQLLAFIMNEDASLEQLANTEAFVPGSNFFRLAMTQTWEDIQKTISACPKRENGYELCKFNYAVTSTTLENPLTIQDHYF